MHYDDLVDWIPQSPAGPPLGWAPCPIFPGTRDLARQSGVRVLTFRLCHDLIGARLYLIGHWARVTCPGSGTARVVPGVPISTLALMMAPLALSRITLIATTFLTFQPSSPAQPSPASPDLRLFLHPLLLEPAPAQPQHRQHGHRHSSRAEARNYRVGCVQECGV